ncbi:helix-turn-helix domain-containing protein [Streptomyces sediminimaris]|uniref:helix-turn-helix domain-containing protein n=1 Tax=Streptomyces sediminimaris TaxID=3383721 RepID=UPI00399A982F
MGRDTAARTEPECLAGDLLAARLRGMRQRTGRSLKELQDVVHASDSSLSRYLSGRIVPPWSVVGRLSEAAGEDSAAVRPLWEHLQREEHRDGRCVPVRVYPPPSVPPAPPARDRDTGIDRAARHRWRPGATVGALVLVTALVSGGSGVWAGLELAPDRRAHTTLTSPQDGACNDWAWPSAGVEGQVDVAPVTVHGDDHAPVVRLENGTVNGRRMAWAEITGARFGDRVWIDWSEDDGRSWTQCGPFAATSPTRTTPAHPLRQGWQFRACGDTPRPAPRYARNQCTVFG